MLPKSRPNLICGIENPTMTNQLSLGCRIGIVENGCKVQLIVCAGHNTQLMMCVQSSGNQRGKDKMWGGLEVFMLEMVDRTDCHNFD
jgi:hypothetical protein